ncbi:MAG: beta-mannosidase [Alistipes sp.]|nr:beta-mannosidase [Alistipes sp.]
MKMFYKLATVLLSAMLFCACGGDDVTDQPTTVMPVVESQSMASGAVDVALTLGQVNVTYARPVTLADAAAVTLTPSMEVEVKAQNRTLTISFDELEYETEYMLCIGAGAVADKATGGRSEALTIRFTTVDKPYTPPTDPTLALVTADALPAAQAVYDYLWDSYGERIISGAMARVAWNTDEADWVAKWTGEYPAMATFDYIHLYASPANWIDYTDISVAKDWWQAGGLVSACWHWVVPASQGSSEFTYDPAKTSFRPGKALTEGTWENAQMKADLSKMADMLLLLQAEGIPVIWRPLHEAAGNIYEYTGGKAWFWWGYDGAETYVALWRTMFDYFRSRGVNNLIWVWTTQTKDDAFYPGDDYVDIIGTDIYNRSASEIAAQHAGIKARFPHKIITLSEMGNVADIADQWEAGAAWSYFMPWYDYGNDLTSTYQHQHATIAWWRRALASERLVTRDELPDFR